MTVADEAAGWAEAQRRIEACRETQGEELDLGGLQLTRVPEEVYELGWLRRLYLGADAEARKQRDFDGYGEEDKKKCNALGALPDALCKALAQLELLDLAHNEIGDDGARALAGLVNLTSLDLAGNSIGADGAKALSGLVNLTSLNLSNNEIGADGARALSGLVNLTSLNLGGNSIGDDGARDLAGLVNLTSLDLGYNSIGADGAKALSGLANLTSLNLRSIGIGDDMGIGADGARALAGLVNLTSLDLEGNDIGPDGAKALSSLVKLTSLDLSVNRIGPDGAQALAELTALTRLELVNNRVGNGVRHFVRMSKLAYLDLTNNNIQSDDAFYISQLIALEHLKLWCTTPENGPGYINRIGEGLRYLHCLRNLKTLDLSNNELSDAHMSHFADFHCLNSLHLPGNQIGPDGAQVLACLTNLTSLDLSDNQVGDAGVQALAGLFNLTSLKLSATGLTNAAPLLGLLKLRALTLDGCDLASDIAPICNMPSLETLDLANGSVRGLDSALLSESYGDNCLPQLRAHFADLRATATAGDDGGHAVTDVKFMILGNGFAGKTQIVRRLRGEPFDPAVPSTHGIQVKEAQLATDAGELPIVLRIWDFGGQDIYHGTHALFLKSRAVFPIVWSADTTDKEEHERHGHRWRNYPLDYWLAYVKHLGGRQSPVLLVQAKVDTPADRRTLPLAEDWAKGLDWHDALTSSAATPRGMNVLREKVIDAVLWLRDTQGVMRIGAGRAAVKAEIEKRQASGRRLLPRTEFDALCDTTGGISSKDYLLEFLHNIGTVFYRQGLFGDQLILDQAWALNAVYAVFDRERSYHQLKRQGGRFDRALLGALVWDEDKHSLEDQEQFIQFMRTSGMCFQLRRASAGFEAEYIAPDLLPEREHPDVQERLAWFDPARVDAYGKIAFALLPQGLLRTVMAGVGERAGRAGTYWRDGFAFYDEDTKARVLVEQAWSKDWSGEIAVSCVGGDAAKLLERTLALVEERTERFGAKPASRSTSLDRAREDKPRRAARELGRDRRDPAADLEPGFAPTAQPELYVSYAWGDATPEGVVREKTVDDFCAAAEARRLEIVRDKTAMQNGDEIPKFMDRLVQAEQVFVFLSDKYLKSPYCMYELFGVWRVCGELGDKFRQRTKFFVFPSAQIYSEAGIDGYQAHWEREAAALEKKIARRLKTTAVERFARMKRFQRYATDSQHVLEFIRGLKHASNLDDFIADALQTLPARAPSRGS